MRRLIPLCIVVIALLAGCPMDPVPDNDTDSPLVGLWTGEFDELGAVTLTFADTTATFTAATVPSSDIIRVIFPNSSGDVKVTCNYMDTGRSITIDNCEGGNVSTVLLLLNIDELAYTITNNTLTFAILTNFPLTRQNTNAPTPARGPQNRLPNQHPIRLPNRHPNRLPSRPLNRHPIRWRKTLP